jgi:hypothetical protein
MRLTSIIACFFLCLAVIVRRYILADLNAHLIAQTHPIVLVIQGVNMKQSASGQTKHFACPDAICYKVLRVLEKTCWCLISV